MLKTLFQAVPRFIKTRRATRQLAAAIVGKDFDGMRQALADGANPDKATYTFNEPMMHFQELYDVCGALELAVHEKLPAVAFEILLEGGARPLSDESLFTGEKQLSSLRTQVEALLERKRLEASTAEAGALGGRRAARL